MARTRFFHDLPLVAVVVLAAGTFLPALANGFALDDLIHIVGNSALRTLDGLRLLLLFPQYPGDLYRPFTMVSYWLCFQTAGLNSLAFHALDVALHACVAASILKLLRELGLTSLAFPVAALFAVHPLHVEAVANCTGRAELLAALCAIAAARIGIQPRSWNQPVLLLLLSLTAFLSKESALSLIALLPLCVWTLGIRTSREPLLVLVSSACLFLGWRLWVVGLPALKASALITLDNPLTPLSSFTRVPIALALLGRYFLQSIWPRPLSADYSFADIDPATFWAAPSSLIYLAAFAVLITAAWLSRRVAKEITFFSLWFLAAFAVTANVLFPIGTVYAERLAYLPSIGSIGILCAVASRFLPASTFRITLGIVVGLFSCQSILHSAVWKNNESLYRYQIQVSELSAKTQANYAVVLRNQGNYDGADQHFRRALEIYPGFSNAAYGIGTLYVLKNIPGGAEHWFHEALQKEPGHIDSIIALGRLYLNQQRLEASEAMFQKALAIDSRSFDAKLGLLAIALTLKDSAKIESLSMELQAQDAYNPELRSLLNKASS